MSEILQFSLIPNYLFQPSIYAMALRTSDFSMFFPSEAEIKGKIKTLFTISNDVDHDIF
jgi:hypothetical protein